MKLSERESLFLDTLCKIEHGYCSESFLQSKLKEFEMGLEEFKRIKKKLLYEGYIGIVYGNITLEKKINE